MNFTRKRNIPFASSHMLGAAITLLTRAESTRRLFEEAECAAFSPFNRAKQKLCTLRYQWDFERTNGGEWWSEGKRAGYLQWPRGNLRSKFPFLLTIANVQDW